MTEHVEISGLSVDRTLEELVRKDIAPGTGVDPMPMRSGALSAKSSTISLPATGSFCKNVMSYRRESTPGTGSTEGSRSTWAHTGRS